VQRLAKGKTQKHPPSNLLRKFKRWGLRSLRKIASCLGGRLPQKRISFSLFALPANSLREFIRWDIAFNLLVPSVLICERSKQISRGLFSETERKSQCQKNQKLIKICPKKSTSVPSAVR
jgi:hypothetical protein